MKNRRLQVGLLVTMSDFENLDDTMHDMDAVQIIRTRKAASQRREEKRDKRDRKREVFARAAQIPGLPEEARKIYAHRAEHS